MMLSPRGGSYAAFPPHPHLLPHGHSQHGSSGGSPSHHHLPPPSLLSSSSAEQQLEQSSSHPPYYPSLHLHASSSFSLSSPSSSASSPHHPLSSPDSQWGSSGKLKQQARAIFERAYGLNGRQREEHPQLCEEVMRSTQCSHKSFEELVYGHSYDTELGDLRAQVADYRPREAKKRVGGRMGKKKAEAELSALGGGRGGALLPLFSHGGYSGHSTPVSASRYELAFANGGSAHPPRRKSLDASILSAFQHGGSAAHPPPAHLSTLSSSSFFSSSMSHQSAASSSPFGDFDASSGAAHVYSSTPSHSALRHRANFSSAAAAAAAAADSVVAYVSSTPTAAVTHSWTAPPVIGSPKHAQQAVLPSATPAAVHSHSLAPGTASASTPSLSSASSSSSPSSSASSPFPSSLASPALRSSALLSSPSSSGSASGALAASTTLAPVTLASIKSSVVMASPAVASKLSTPSPAPAAPSESSSRSSSRSTTPLPPSPTSQPPRPVSILIPSSPAVSNEDSELEESLNISGSSAGVKEQRAEGDDDEPEQRLREQQRSQRKEERGGEERKEGGEAESVQPQPQQPAQPTEPAQSALAKADFLHWPAQPKQKAALRQRLVREEKKDRSQLQQPFSTAVQPHSPAPSTSSAALASHEQPMVAPPTAASLPTVAPPAVVDFAALPLPSFASLPTSSLATRAAVFTVGLTLLRLYATYVSSVPSALDFHTALAFFLSLTVTAVGLLCPAFLPSPTSPSSSLAFHLSSYVLAWELLSTNDFAQLLAAYQQVQQLTLAAVHSLHDHTAALLTFLDAAHRHLHSEHGYSPLIHQLFTQHHHIASAVSVSTSSTQPPGAASSVFPWPLVQLLVSCVALLSYVLLPMHSLALGGLSLCLHLLLPYLIALLLTALLLAALERARRQMDKLDDIAALLHLAHALDHKVQRLTQQQQQGQQQPQHEKAAAAASVATAAASDSSA